MRRFVRLRTVKLIDPSTGILSRHNHSSYSLHNKGGPFHSRQPCSMCVVPDNARKWHPMLAICFHAFSGDRPHGLIKIHLSHKASRTSPDRVAVSTRNSKANFIDGQGSVPRIVSTAPPTLPCGSVTIGYAAITLRPVGFERCKGGNGLSVHHSRITSKPSNTGSAEMKGSSRARACAASIRSNGSR